MLILDSEAASALAHGPSKRKERVRALLTAARRRGEPIAIVAAVLAEIIRGRAQDAAVFGALSRNRVEVRAVDSRVGVRAGQLLGAVRASSALAVDAFCVAVADLSGGAVIVTGDPDDLERLASHCDEVSIIDISAS
jgi:predicted nucleic acid-binding protein